MGKRGVGFYWKLAFTNLKGNRRVYLPYLLSSVGIIMMFYSINALGQGIDQGALYGGTTVASMMGLGVFVIGLFAVLFLFYTNSFIIKRRKKELGLYNILGMDCLLYTSFPVLQGGKSAIIGEFMQAYLYKNTTDSPAAEKSG